MRRLLSTDFSQPAGSHVVAGELRGYYVDFRVKAESPEWPPLELQPLDRQLHVDVIQWGLGAWEHYLETGSEEWLRAALAVAEHLLAAQDGSGGWVHRFAYPHTFPLAAPWLSAMAQGEGASLLVRLWRETGEERMLDGAVAARLPLLRPVADGGVQAALGGGPFLEEYPTDPPSYVLNGAIFSLWGCLDLFLATGDEEMRALFEEGVDALSSCLSRWDTGWWSRYDLFPHPVRNIASEAYHALHVTQLRALDLTAPRPALRSMADRWEAAAASRVNRARAFGWKVAFRLAVPRNPALARRLPWVR